VLVAVRSLASGKNHRESLCKRRSWKEPLERVERAGGHDDVDSVKTLTGYAIIRIAFLAFA
jgi:hypothetical protein